MEVLITGAASDLGRTVAAELSDGHKLRLFDSTPVEPGENAVAIEGELTDPMAVWSAVRGVDAILHLGEPPADLPDDELARDQALLDHATRGTHVLFSAAVDAHVRRFVFGSTLEVFDEYPDDVYISENWKPLPSPRMAVMSRYLGEGVCRCFVRTNRIGVTVLRLGRQVLEEEVRESAGDLMWVDRRDAASAFACALQRDAADAVTWSARWDLFHICAPIHNGKFLIDHALRMGFAPERSFAHHWAPTAED
jgi:hypothetical protein